MVLVEAVCCCSPQQVALLVAATAGGEPVFSLVLPEQVDHGGAGAGDGLVSAAALVH